MADSLSEATCHRRSGLTSGMRSVAVARAKGMAAIARKSGLGRRTYTRPSRERQTGILHRGQVLTALGIKITAAANRIEDAAKTKAPAHTVAQHRR